MRTGFARAMLQRGWRPMAGGSFITYRRGLKPLQTYTLRFRLDGGDAHWNYMRFEFMRHGRVCAAGYMKGAAVARDGLVPERRVVCGDAAWPCPELAVPEPVRHWLAAEHGVMNAAW